MSQFPDSKFLQSADASSQFVSDLGSEVAVAGRSNVGKSSVINVIVNRRQFARTSKTPGRTQLVNFFELHLNSCYQNFLINEDEIFIFLEFIYIQSLFLSFFDAMELRALIE